MGQFSWITVDTNKAITNNGTRNGALPVYLLIPKEFGGGYIYEDDYNGYGVFDGKDAYALLAQWNFPELCSGNDKKDRVIGIEHGCYDEQMANLKYKLRFVENLCNYEDIEGFSKIDPNQGWGDFDEED